MRRLSPIVPTTTNPLFGPCPVAFAFNAIRVPQRSLFESALESSRQRPV